MLEPPRLPPFGNSIIQREAPAAEGGRLHWRARNTANHYELIDASSEIVQSMASFYGLSEVLGTSLPYLGQAK